MGSTLSSVRALSLALLVGRVVGARGADGATGHVGRVVLVQGAGIGAGAGRRLDERPGGDACEQQRRRVYIDLGANWANTLRLYKTLAPEHAHLAWEVYAWEASPLIQPYLHQFCTYLSGERDSEPELCLPRSGSTKHLWQYARQLQCAPQGANATTMRHCMWGRFDRHLRALAAEPLLNSSCVYAEQLAHSARPLPCGAQRSRFTAIPAAVGGSDGWMKLVSVPHMLIRGGAKGRLRNDADIRRASPWYTGARPYTFQARVGDVASWMVASFRAEDDVVVKLDVEGGEFGFIPKLIARGGMGLVDVLALECHQEVGNCDELRAAIVGNATKAGFHIVEEASLGKYGGVDHESRVPPQEELLAWAKRCNLLLP